MTILMDRLAIGGLDDGENHPQVDAILNLSQIEYATTLIYKHVHFADFEYLKDLSVIRECTAFIREQIGQRRRVLVHCFAGISRSSMICMAYLYECGMSFDEALAFIQRKHPVAQPHEELVRALYDWYGVTR